jgi:hypothetical protein
MPGRSLASIPTYFITSYIFTSFSAMARLQQKSAGRKFRRERTFERELAEAMKNSGILDRDPCSRCDWSRDKRPKNRSGQPDPSDRQDAATRTP